MPTSALPTHPNRNKTKEGENMPDFSASNMLVLVLAGMLIWLCLNVLISVVKIRRTGVLSPSRFLYPADCKPELCRDPAGFIAFAFPRMTAFSVLGLLLAALLVVNELTELFSFLPPWFSNYAALFLFIPLFGWYMIFISKAAKRFW